MFADGQNVISECGFCDGYFQNVMILTRCDTKYNPLYKMYMLSPFTTGPWYTYTFIV